MIWLLTLEEFDYENSYGAGTKHKNPDWVSRIHVVQNMITNEEFENFKIAESKPIINLKIKEIEGSIKNVETTKELILPISGDKTITHNAIREIIKMNEQNVQNFNNGNFIIINNANRNIFFFKLKPTFFAEIDALTYFNAICYLKQFCINSNIIKMNDYSTRRTYVPD